jgi:hypothetical protein
MFPEFLPKQSFNICSRALRQAQVYAVRGPLTAQCFMCIPGMFPEYFLNIP